MSKLLFWRKDQKAARAAGLNWSRTADVVPAAEDFYLLPRTANEAQRLDFQHYLFVHLLGGKLYRAPLIPSQVHRILDIGCGTGRWAQEMSRHFRHAQVIGFDLSCQYHNPLPETKDNYRFIEGSLFDGLPFADRSSDFTHQRLLFGGIPKERWAFDIEELARVTEFGGWISMIEMGNEFQQPGPATQQLLTWWIAYSGSQGIDTAISSRLDGLMRSVGGLRHVRRHVAQVPLGRWGGRLGQLMAQDMLAGIPSMREPYQRVLDVNPLHFDAVVNGLVGEWEKYRTSFAIYFYDGMR
jgi:SAM-dependent methyltransferase